MWYAQNSARRTHQLVGDAVVFLWTALWATAAVVSYRLTCLLAVPRALREHRSPFPLIGGSVDSAVRQVADAADGLHPVLVRVGVTVGALALFVVPVGVLLAVWLPRRLRWVRRAGAARDLAASEDGRDLLALRSLLRPLDELAATASEIPGSTVGSLAGGWRQGDPEILDALADAELDRLGLLPPPSGGQEPASGEPAGQVGVIAPSRPGDDRAPDPRGVG
ncbi:hypothetical protein [Streptomyces sp. NRRL S-1521]|uniref:hypothetical protein n=1 Tax=Streptomyces sp. NRRL S-1521 TaxID=1609100 RepID=UPI000B0BC0CD|nr:hypothetical protein [Streptomyces sp. NRRL S-1521]